MKSESQPMPAPHFEAHMTFELTPRALKRACVDQNGCVKRMRGCDPSKFAHASRANATAERSRLTRAQIFHSRAQRGALPSSQRHRRAAALRAVFKFTVLAPRVQRHIFARRFASFDRALAAVRRRQRVARLARRRTLDKTSASQRER